MTDKYTGEQISLVDGKYTVRKKANGSLEVLLYGEVWRDLAGDNLVAALFDELLEARQAAQMMREREPSIDVSTHAFWGKQREREAVKVTDEDVERALNVFFEHGRQKPYAGTMHAALESFAAHRAAVPNGWKLVPVEPTDAMMDVGTSKHECAQGDPWYGAPALSDVDCVAIYQAMLAAAPEVTK